MNGATERGRDSCVWQDVECGSYEADMALWEELATSACGPVLELGCGVGRVTLHLARQGHEMVGLDNDAAMVAGLRERSKREDLGLRVEICDAKSFSLDERFGLVLAPMQLIELLPGPEARLSCLRAVARHLLPGGPAAFAVVDRPVEGIPASPPLPDVRERDGHVYSSLPLGVVANGEVLHVDRLRQTVGPDGWLRDERHTTRLWTVSPERLETEAGEAGMCPAGRRAVAPTESHVGSTVVMLEA
ncbi:MAG: methyltransferase domain-containing protein [Actinomycetota bacterium]